MARWRIAAGVLVLVVAALVAWLVWPTPSAKLPLHTHAVAAPPPIAMVKGAPLAIALPTPSSAAASMMASALLAQRRVLYDIGLARRYHRSLPLSLALPADTLLVATQRLQSAQVMHDLVQAAQQHQAVWVMLGRNAQDARDMAVLQRAGIQVRYTPRRFVQYPTIIYLAAAQRAVVSADALDTHARPTGVTFGAQGAQTKVVEEIFVADWYRRPASQVVSPALARRANIAVGPWQHAWRFPVTQAHRGGQVTIAAPSLVPLVLQLWRQWDDQTHWHVPVQVMTSSNVSTQTAQRLLGVTQVQTLRAPAPQAGLMIMAPGAVVGWAQTSTRVGPHIRWIGAWVQPF